MTTQEIIDYMQSLVDDTLDSAFLLDLAKAADEKIRSERDWEILKKLDTSKSTAAGDTYTSTKALPTDFFAPSRYIFINRLPHRPIPFVEREAYRDTPRVYYIDYANAVFGICGSQATASTITFPYIYKPSDLTTSTSPVFPSDFHKLWAYEMASLYEAGIDADDTYFRMSAEQKLQARMLWDRLISWDARLKLHSMDHSAASIDSSLDVNEPDTNLGNY